MRSAPAGGASSGRVTLHVPHRAGRRACEGLCRTHLRGEAFPEFSSSANLRAKYLGACDLGQGAVKQSEETAPGTLRLRFVVDLRIGRAPAVHRAFVDLDFGG